MLKHTLPTEVRLGCSVCRLKTGTPLVHVHGNTHSKKLINAAHTHGQNGHGARMMVAGYQTFFGCHFSS